MCLAGSRCLEKLHDSLEVTAEIFADFHLQSGFFMWLQRLCKGPGRQLLLHQKQQDGGLLSSECSTLSLSANCERCFAMFAFFKSLDGKKNDGFHLSIQPCVAKTSIWFGVDLGTGRSSGNPWPGR